MLKKADTDIRAFSSIFADLDIDVAFLVPTPTGLKKSIMDATAPIRILLKSAGIHDYATQSQGPEAKVILRGYFVLADGTRETKASLYRPVTKHGDPRIWFSGLKTYCDAYNLLALMVYRHAIYVINLSNPEIEASMRSHGYVYDLLVRISEKDITVYRELLSKIQLIHNQGFIPSITNGDPGVGDTLENALGIHRNNRKAPDYKGIELKATRLDRGGRKRTPTRSVLFSLVPDKGLSYREILETYGKVQIPRGKAEARLQLYETFRASRPNAYGLKLTVDDNNDELIMYYAPLGTDETYVSSWKMERLRKALATKHHETFWVKASTEYVGDAEHFRYDKITHTKNPNTLLLGPLIMDDVITLDLAAHRDATGRYRDHGMLFKIAQADLPLLFGTPVIYDLDISF